MISEPSSSINAFEMGAAYWFIIPGIDVPPDLASYYDRSSGRYEVPHRWIDTVAERLSGHGYRLEIVANPTQYCVVGDIFESHTWAFRTAVAHWRRASQRVFLLPDAAAVRKARERGLNSLPSDNTTAESRHSTPISRTTRL